MNTSARLSDVSATVCASRSASEVASVGYPTRYGSAALMHASTRPTRLKGLFSEGAEVMKLRIEGSLMILTTGIKRV